MHSEARRSNGNATTRRSRSTLVARVCQPIVSALGCRFASFDACDDASQAANAQPSDGGMFRRSPLSLVEPASESPLVSEFKLRL